MLSLNGGSRIFFCSDDVTFRVRHRGLKAYIRASLGRDPMCGDVFIFMSRSRDKLRVYYFHDGEVLIEKHLHGCRYLRPVFEDKARNVHHMAWKDFIYLLEGVIRKGDEVRLIPEEDVYDALENGPGST